MKLTFVTKHILVCKRFRKKMMADGWEYVGEGAHILGMMSRGNRMDEMITECAVDIAGDGLWVKTAKRSTDSTDFSTHRSCGG